MREYMEKLYRGDDLTSEATEELFNTLLRGDMEPIMLASLLTALRMKGESIAEISGAARAMLAAARPFPRPDYAFADIVGTGGDGANSINISTLATLTGAECGIKIAKHGSTSVSSRTGASDLLNECGVRLDMSPEIARRCLDELNVCFLFAPVYHTAMRHAVLVRKTLATRTLFNLLGPLVNPARPTHQLMGVYSPELIEPIARTLLSLGLQRGMVVHGSGLDEIALHGNTQVADIQDGQVRVYQLTPADFGLPLYSLSGIRGGEPAENRRISETILMGNGTDAQNAAIALNIAPLLQMFGKVENLKQGAELAIATLKSGRVLNRLSQFAAMSHAPE